MREDCESAFTDPPKQPANTPRRIPIHHVNCMFCSTAPGKPWSVRLHGLRTAVTCFCQRTPPPSDDRQRRGAIGSVGEGAATPDGEPDWPGSPLCSPCRRRQMPPPPPSERPRLSGRGRGRCPHTLRSRHRRRRRRRSRAGGSRSGRRAEPSRAPARHRWPEPTPLVCCVSWY